MEKNCRICKQWKLLGDFYAGRRVCKQCVRDDQNTKRGYEKIPENSLDKRHSDKRKIRGKEIKITEESIFNIEGKVYEGCKMLEIPLWWLERLVNNRKCPANIKKYINSLKNEI